MFERFTDVARRVVVFAQEESRLLHDNAIRTEHLLLALFQVDATALREADVDEVRLRDEIARRHPAAAVEPSGHIPFTPRAKKALEQSGRASDRLGIRAITPDVILVGVLATDGCDALAVLEAVGTDMDRLRRLAERAAIGSHPGDREPAQHGLETRRPSSGLRELARLLEQVAAQRDRFERALLRYGRHIDGCVGAAACTCGLQRVLDELDAPEA